MAFSRWPLWASLVLLAGGLSWLAKQAVIVATATDGHANESAPIAFFYLLGGALLLVGSTGVGLWLTRRRGLIARVSAAILSPIAFIALYSVLDSIGKPLVGTRGPAYLPDEVGIIAAAVVALGLGVWLFTTSRRASDARSGTAGQSHLIR
jgi:hypothetical protein